MVLKPKMFVTKLLTHGLYEIAFNIGNFGLFTLKISCFFTITNQKVHFVIWKASICLKLFKYTFKPITSEILLFVYNLSAVS